MSLDDFEPLLSKNIRRLPNGTEVLCRQLHWDKDSKPTTPTYYRTILGRHMTVSGMMEDLRPEPNADFPETPPWQMGWIYAGNQIDMTLMIRKGVIDQSKDKISIPDFDAVELPKAKPKDEYGQMTLELE